MAKFKKNTKAIFQWTFKGTEVAGQIPVYSTQLRDDGTLSCNCPGWIFHRNKAAPRICKHTKEASKEAPALFKKWKSGEALPKMMQDPLAAMLFSTGSGMAQPKSEYGRVIELD